MNDETIPAAPTSAPEPTAPPASVAHCGMVAVVGRTNAGKSTLVNRIIGEKVSIVTPVAQTTRSNVRAILTDARGQLVLVDTPGLHKSQSKLCTAMNRVARSSIEGVDAVLLVLDGSREPLLEDDGWMRRLLFVDTPCIFLLNKEDAGHNPQPFMDLWLSLQTEKQHTKENVTWCSASAATGRGVPALVDALFAALPPGPLLFDAETVTDHPRKIAVADVIREKYFLLLDDEMPHNIGIRVDEIREHDNMWDVESTLYVHRASQKAIVIGPKGRMLRAVKRKAEPELSEMFGVDVRLNIWIKIEKGWDENYFILKQMGYVR
jgi:GTP-binding protein Era